MDLSVFGARGPVVAVDIADRRGEDVDAGCDEVVDIRGGCEEGCSANSSATCPLVQVSMWN